jgi:thiamine transport system permease protein
MGIRHALIAAGAAAMAIAVAAPVGYFALRAWTSAGPGEAPAAVLSALGDAGTWRTVAFTLGQAGLSALLAVLAGLPGAYVVSHFRFRLERLVRAVTLIPFVLPSIVVVICMVSFWGRGGLVGRLTGADASALYGLGGILVAHVFYNLSLAVRIVGEGWERIDRRLHESAFSLGESRAGAFLRVTLPLLAPSVLTAFLLVFLYCFLSFGVVLVFGGARFATLEVGIYREMYVRLDLPRALTLAAVELALSMAFTFLTSSLLGRLAVSGTRGRRSVERKLADLPPGGRALLAIYGVTALVFLLGPLLTLVGRAFSPGGEVGLESFAALFAPRAGGRDVNSILRSTVPAVIGTSLLTAAASGTLCFAAAVTVSLSLGRKASPLWDSLFQLPLGLSVVTVCIGVDLLASDLLRPGASRVPLVVLMQAFIAFPLVYRIARTTVASLQEGYLESARSLGAGPLARLLDVELPLLRRGLLNAYAYGLAVAFADFTAAMTVGRGDVVTFPVAIYRLIGFRSFDLALALGVLYVALCALLFVLIDTTSMPARKAR